MNAAGRWRKNRTKSKDSPRRDLPLGYRYFRNQQRPWGTHGENRAHLTFWHVSKRHSTIAQAFKPGIAFTSRTSSPEGTTEIARLHGSAQKLRCAWENI